MRTSIKYGIKPGDLETRPKLVILQKPRKPLEENLAKQEVAAMKRLRRRQRNLELAAVGGF